MADTVYFKPLQNRMDCLRDAIVKRLRGCSLGRWIMFICVRICESFAIGDVSQNATYNLWINQVDQVLRGKITGNDVSNSIQGQLVGEWLGVRSLLNVR